MFVFKKRSEITDPRSILANYICELLCVHRYDGDVSRATWNFEQCHDLLHNVIHNFYECVDTEIPFVALYQLLKYGKDNFDMTEEEHDAAIEACKRAIDEYFFPELFN
jgi:hypothetical protein